MIRDQAVSPIAPVRQRTDDADELKASRPRDFLASHKSEVEQSIADRFGVTTFRDRLAGMIARDLSGSNKDLVDGIAGVIRTRKDQVAIAEVNELEHVAALEPDGAGESLSMQIQQHRQNFDFAEVPFEIHETSLDLKPETRKPRTQNPEPRRNRFLISDFWVLGSGLVQLCSWS